MIMTFGLGLILGIFIGVYFGNPVMRKRINAKLLQKIPTGEHTVTKVCKACEGLGLQTLKNGVKIECPSCEGTGKRKIMK